MGRASGGKKGGTSGKGARGAKKSSRARRLAFRWGAPVLFLIGLLLFLTFLLFSGGVREPVDPAGLEDLALFQKLSVRLVQEAMQGKPEESELVLSPEDLLRLRRCADSGILPIRLAYPALRVADGVRNYDWKAHDGVLELALPVDTSWPILFGGVLTVRAEVVPYKDGEDFSIETRKARVGAFPIPATWVNLAADKAIAKQRSRRSFRKFMEAVRSIRFDEAGNLRIIYAPPALRGLFF